MDVVVVWVFVVDVFQEAVVVVSTIAGVVVVVVVVVIAAVALIVVVVVEVIAVVLLILVVIVMEVHKNRLRMRFVFFEAGFDQFRPFGVPLKA